jgi:hypothetical protein
MTAGIAHQADIFALALIGELAEILAEQDIGEAENGVQRRAQLMADGGEEARLGVVCRLRLDRMVLRFDTQLVFDRDIAQLGDDAEQRAIAVAAGGEIGSEMRELAIFR